MERTHAVRAWVGGAMRARGLTLLSVDGLKMWHGDAALREANDAPAYIMYFPKIMRSVSGGENNLDAVCELSYGSYYGIKYTDTGSTILFVCFGSAGHRV